MTIMLRLVVKTHSSNIILLESYLLEKGGYVFIPEPCTLDKAVQGFVQAHCELSGLNEFGEFGKRDTASLVIVGSSSRYNSSSRSAFRYAPFISNFARDFLDVAANLRVLMIASRDTVGE